MPAVRAAVPVLFALVCGVVFLVLDPAKTVRAEAVDSFVRAGIPAVLAMTGALGVGGALLRAFAPAALGAPSGWLAALGVGVAVQGAWMGGFALFGAMNPLTAWAVLLATNAAWAARPGVRLPHAPGSAWIIACALLFPGLLDALAPPTDTDELSYHLSLPRRMIETGHLLGGFFTPDGSRPMSVHLVFATLYGAGGEAAPRLWHLLLSAALALGVRSLAEARFGPGRGDLPALALLGSQAWLREAGLAYDNHIVALYLLVAADAVLTRRYLLMGWMCGFALAAKYTAAPAVAGLALVAIWDGLRGEPRRVILAGVATLLPLVPWWLRNLAEGLHPLFPFAGWPPAQDGAEFIFMYPEKYGIGRDLVARLRLPFDLLFRAEVDSFAFLGRVSLLWLGLGVAAIGGARRDPALRRLLFVLLVGFAGWAAGAQIFRYLLPLFGIAALAGGALPRALPGLLLLLLSLPANLSPIWARATTQAAVVRGAETPDDFLTRELSAWPALRYLRDHVSPDAPVAGLFAWHNYWVKQPFLLGSVEDHVPTRYWVWQRGEASLTTLRELGVVWLLVGDVRFLKKSYAFLPPSVLDAQFTRPRDQLRELLLRDATRVFAQDRWEVWRIDPPALDAPPPPP
jgi:hypothetical protein